MKSSASAAGITSPAVITRPPLMSCKSTIATATWPSGPARITPALPHPVARQMPGTGANASRTGHDETSAITAAGGDAYDYGVDGFPTVHTSITAEEWLLADR